MGGADSRVCDCFTGREEDDFGAALADRSRGELRPMPMRPPAAGGMRPLMDTGPRRRAAPTWKFWAGEHGWQTDPPGAPSFPSRDAARASPRQESWRKDGLHVHVQVKSLGVLRYVTLRWCETAGELLSPAGGGWHCCNPARQTVARCRHYRESSSNSDVGSMAVVELHCGCFLCVEEGTGRRLELMIGHGPVMMEYIKQFTAAGDQRRLRQFYDELPPLVVDMPMSLLDLRLCIEAALAADSDPRRGRFFHCLKAALASPPPRTPRADAAGPAAGGRQRSGERTQPCAAPESTRASWRNGDPLEHAPPSCRADRQVVCAAVARDGTDLKHASSALRADKAIVLAAVAQNGRALRFAGGGLQGDRDVAMVAIASDAMAMEFVADRLRQDGGFLEAAQHRGVLMHTTVDCGPPRFEAPRQLRNEPDTPLASPAAPEGRRPRGASPAAPPGASPSAPAAAAPGSPPANPELARQLIGMGFAAQAVQAASRRCSSVEAAVEWLSAHPEVAA